MERVRPNSTLKIICLVIAFSYLVLFLGLAYLRLVYPYEVEWMEGAMMDHALRVVEGKAIYTAPSIDFVAWLYPPLYYYIVAGAIKLFGVGWFAGRSVSLLSSIGTGILLGVLTTRITSKRLLGVFTLCLFIATYHATGYYFDIARNDAFFTFLLVLTAFAALTLRGVARPLITALLLLLCFLTKQQAVFFLPCFALWFWLSDRRNGILFLVAATLTAGVLYIVINHSTGGWYFYYLFKIPGAKRAEFSVMRTFNVFSDYAFRSFTICTLAAIGIVWFRSSEKLVFWKSSTGLLVLMAIASLGAGAMSLGNEGGYKNVMLPFAAFVVIFLPIAMDVLERWKPEFVNVGFALLLCQFVAFYFNPLSEQMLIASDHQRKGADEFLAQLRKIDGEVYIPYHSFIARQAGKASHAHILATIDVLRMHDSTALRLQSNYDSAYAHHRFAGVIMEESKVFRLDSVDHYTMAKRMVIEPNTNLTRVADDVTRPEYLFLPATLRSNSAGIEGAKTSNGEH